MSEARLRDRIGPSPRILLVGINPSLRSAAVGHHFAGRGNPFWRLLHAARLVPEPLGPDDDERVIEHGLGLTNLCPRPTRAAAELSSEEMEAGRRALLRKVARVRPGVVCLVGVTLYRQVFPRPAGGPGPGPKPERIAHAPVFVVPNPSGLNASFPGFASKLEWFAALRAFADAHANR